ncbi:MAG: CDP-diacylglycerol--glycerol-3-phosphate 3-phosphatidyltransferase [Deltaproteobacteria bacterium]|nr:CDP-diacylglycerol--glycerol-3-phosphate 3-phosphatidyltransferase [Deltaproteobacteria bacterium]
MLRTDLFNLPNYVSGLRIALAPVVIGLMLSIHPGAHEGWNRTASILATIFYVIASLSDIIDGILARRARLSSVMGKLLDPLADKFLNLSVLVMLVPLHRMTAWLAVLIIAREMGVTTLRGIAGSEGIVIAAGKWGKMKNAFGSVGTAMLLVYYPFFGIDWFMIGWVLFLISAVLSLGSGMQYTVGFFRGLERKRA